MNMARIREKVLHVLEGWPLYEPIDVLSVTALPSEQRFFIGYCTHLRFSLLSLNAQFDTGILYLLEIELPPFLCGQGHGSQLYDCVVEIARALELREVRQTPSGWTPSGETREDWLARHGWKAMEGGREVYKLVDECKAT